MNVQKTPAYLVYHQHETLEPSQTLFTHDKLLTARKAAMCYVEKRLAELWQRGDRQNRIEVHLIESATQPLSVEGPAVAKVYQLNLPTGPKPCYLEAKERYYFALEQLHEEFTYYQTHGYSMGFGYFREEVREGESCELYCHLYDASGYVNQLAGIYEIYRQDLDLPQLLTYFTHDDQHYRAGLLLDELAG